MQVATFRPARLGRPERRFCFLAHVRDARIQSQMTTRRARQTRLRSLELRHSSRRLRRLATGPVFALDVTITRPRRFGTVLVADDAPGVREAVAHLLSLAGHRVLFAENAHVVIDVMQNHDVDVLILGMNVIQVDGWAALRNLRPPVAQVIVCTDQEASPGDTRECLGVRPFSILSKPVSASALLAEIDWALLNLRP